MSCGYDSSIFKYEPVGHVVTGNLKDRHLRPSYREQNNINWNKVGGVFLEVISRYRIAWARREWVGNLGDWEHEVDTLKELRI